MSNGTPRYPRNAADWTRLDADLLSDYLLRKGERLALKEYKARFLRAHWWPGRVAFPFEVEGDTTGMHVVWVEPYRPDGWWAHCDRGGDHDLQPARAACGHMTAAAIELATNVVPGLGDQLAQTPDPEAAAWSGERQQDAASGSGPTSRTEGDDAPSVRAANPRRLVEDYRQPGFVTRERGTP